MSETGWRITALVLGLTTIGGIFGTVANRHALAEAERLLAAERADPRIEPGLIRIIREPCAATDPVRPHEPIDPQPESVCKYGVLMNRTADGWESITDPNGSSVPCT